MREITDFVETLNADGTPKCPGYCYKNYYVYNRDKIKCREARIKEWEFYQFAQDGYVIQLTIGHATVFDNFSFNFFNVNTGKKFEFGALRLHRKNRIVYPNPELSHNIFAHGKNYVISFENDNGNRTLRFTGKTKEYNVVKVQVNVTNTLDNDKMVILTPFDNKHQFYLNYKENYYNVTANVKLGENEYNFDNMKGLVDSGRGYWPFKQEWYWSSLTSKLDGHDFGWNLGWGFGNLDYATENMIFLDGKGYQLGKIDCTADFDNPSTSTVQLSDQNGCFSVTLTPVFDNYTHTDVLYVHNSCHQVYYTANGTFTVNGVTYKLENAFCFLEHAKNQW